MIPLLKRDSQFILVKASEIIGLRKLILPFLILALTCGSLQAQVSSYIFNNDIPGYTPLSGGTTAIATGWDNAVSPAITLPFPFIYDGTSQTQCFISANGFLVFGATAPAATTVLPLSTTGGAGVLSPFGVDLISGSAPITYGVVGVSPSRVFVVQWADVARKAQTGNYNFQIRLHETTNVVEYSYGPSNTTIATAVPVQVGLRGLNNTFAQGNVKNLSHASNTTWFNNTAPGTANNVTVRTMTTAYPDLGLSLTWTPPPVCTTPTGSATALILGATLVSDVDIAGNSFTASSPATTNYLVLRSATNTPPTAATIPNRTFGVVNTNWGIYRVLSISGTTTFAQTGTGLVGDTTYYYWVIPYNNNCLGAPYYNLNNMLTGSITTCSPKTISGSPTNVAGNSFTANWSFVTGATDYRIDVATNSTFATILPAYNNLSVGDVNTFNVTGLSPLTSYWYRIRAIGIGCPTNSTAQSTTTICGAYPIPYSQNFDAIAINAVPNCYTRVDDNGDGIQWGVQTTTFASSPKSIMIGANATNNMNDWFFLPGLNMTGGVSYRLTFKYNTRNLSGTVTENLRVMVGSDADPAAMSQTLLDMPNINNTIFTTTSVDYTPGTSGTYYIGYQGSSIANQSAIAIDDISVILSPTCFEPTAVTAVTVAPTTATITWTPPAIEPSNGYDYYLSTSATPPNAGTPITGTVGFGITTLNLTLLTPSTTYHIWVRGRCNGTDRSVWSIEEIFSTECNTPVVSATIPASRCGFGTAVLAATPNSGSVIDWYSAATGGNILLTGNTFTTPVISTTTTYYVEAKAFGAIAKNGPTSPANHGGAVGVQNYNFGSVNFSVSNRTTLQAIDIFPIASGQAGTFTLRDNVGLPLTTFPFVTTVSGGNTAQTILLNYPLQPGNYTLFMGAVPASGIRMNTAGTIFPYNSAVASITGNNVDSDQYLGVYNWKFTTECLSGRIPVIATVSSPPALTISAASSTICENTSTDAITIGGYAAYDSLVWSPNTGVSGSFATGFTFNPIVTTTYTLTTTQTSGSLCANILTHVVNVIPSPAPVAVLPVGPITQCASAILPLNGSTGASSVVPILTEKFNAATNNWTVENTSTYGNTLASQWTLRPSPFTHATKLFSSNDASQFYLANSDAQGTNTYVFTRTTLKSPQFSLVGYTSATLNFWHYLRYTAGDIFAVEISLDNGGSWTSLTEFTASTGAGNGFVNEDLDLSAYIGSPSVTVRFNMDVNYGWYWAVDNVTISGTIASALSWTPATGLYTDAAATVPYVAGTPLSIVYAHPAITTTYTATATGGNGCKSTGTIVINVDALPVGGTLSASQSLCNNVVPTDMILTGSSGNVIRWESADDMAFTVNVMPIANTTGTLTALQIGTVTGIKYFRAVLKNGVCAEVYSTVSSVSFPSTTWNGTSWSNGIPTSGIQAIFNGNFSSSTNLQACSVRVVSGVVTFNDGNSLLVDNAVNVVGGSLVFENGSSLVQYSEALNAGNIVYKRNTTGMVKYDYTYWSSPVALQTLSAFSPNSNPTTFYSWSTSNNNWIFAPGATPMVRAKGYIVRAPDVAPFNTVTPQIFHAAFTGVPNNGNITIPIALNAFDSLNLIGNPYPSAIDAHAFLSDPLNNNVINGTIYLWTHNTPITSNVYTSNDYAVYNYMGGTATHAAPSTGVNMSQPDGTIAAGQSFFVEGLLNTNVTFTNGMRLINANNQFFRSANATTSLSTESSKHRLWLDLSNSQGAFKQILVGYAGDATIGHDRNYDGVYVASENVIGLYSINMNKNYSIQGRSLPFNTADVVPLGYTSSIAGTFQIRLSSFDGLFTSQNIYLEDQLLHVIHDLKAGDYNFTTAIGTFDDRFVLRYTSETLSNPDFNTNNLVIYKNSQEWIVNSGSVNMQSIRVFDIRGSLLFENKQVNSSETRFNGGQVNQVLLVQINSVDGKTVTKKVIN